MAVADADTNATRAAPPSVVLGAEVTINTPLPELDKKGYVKGIPFGKKAAERLAVRWSTCANLAVSDNAALALAHTEMKAALPKNERAIPLINLLALSRAVRALATAAELCEAAAAATTNATSIAATHGAPVETASPEVRDCAVFLPGSDDANCHKYRVATTGGSFGVDDNSDASVGCAADDPGDSDDESGISESEDESELESDGESGDAGHAYKSQDQSGDSR